MKKSQVTIKDIAQKLNLSSSTVSRALHNHPDIRQETKNMVLDLAEQWDYQPDSIAQSLRNKRTSTIGVILPEIKHHFFSSALNGIEDVTYKAGYTIIVCKSNESCEREIVNTRALASNRIAGLIISISQNTTNANHFQFLQKRKIPIVFFDRVLKNVKASKVIVDDYQGAFQAVEHLIQSGYKNIAHIAGPKHLSISKDRFKGYFFALKQYGLPFRKEYVVCGGLNEEDGFHGCERILAFEKLPEAIFAVNDPVAIGVFMKLKQTKLRIPQDVALVGFSNNPISALIDPPLTTVEQPAYEMGKAAANLLLKEIENTDGGIEPTCKKLTTRLIIRSST